jgi:DNA-binding NarL/FixJ family response regulator
MAEAIRVLIVDDHAVVREGLRTFLELQDGIEVAGEAIDGEDAIEEAERLRPDVVLMDLVMPNLDGVGAMRELRQRVPAARVIVLTSFLEDERLLPAVRAGAAGYLLKNVQPQELARAIRTAAAGEALLDPAVAARLVEALEEDGRDARAEQLTPREREVLAQVARGLSNGEIAETLFIEESTVKTHVKRILMKLRLRDRVQAVIFAYESGLTRAGPKSAP